MRSRTTIIATIVVIVAVAVSFLTIRPSGKTAEPQRAVSTAKPVKKPAKKQAKAKPKQTPTAEKVSHDGDFTLHEEPIKLPSELTEGNAPSGWQKPVTVDINAQSLAGTSTNGVIWFSGLQVGQSYRLWVRPAGEDKVYVIDYQSKEAKTFISTPLLRKVLNLSQQDGKAISTFTLYNAQKETH